MIRDGWCHTGDKGYYDSNENIFIIGRYKELIKYRMAHVLIENRIPFIHNDQLTAKWISSVNSCKILGGAC